MRIDNFVVMPIFRQYKDGCYAVVVGNRRGPCGNSKKTAYARYKKSGLIASARSD